MQFPRDPPPRLLLPVDDAAQDLGQLLLRRHPVGDVHHARPQNPFRGAEADDGEAVRSVVAHLKGLAATVGNEVHRLAWELRPIALDDLGLGAAVQNYADEWSQTSGVACDLHLALTNRRLPPDVETTLYRVLQEALTNVVKHARARRVGVVAKASSAEAVMIIEDDGAGFDPERVGATPRLGLRGVRERLAAIHGSLEIESTPGHGTTLMIRVPLAGSARGASARQPA